MVFTSRSISCDRKSSFLPAASAAAHGLLGLLDVMREPRQLFGDVALLDHDDDFLGDAVLIDVDAGHFGDLLHALLIRSQQLAADLVAMPGQPRLQFANRLQARGDVGAQRLPFAHAHGGHLRERVAHERRERFALVFGISASIASTCSRSGTRSRSPPENVDPSPSSSAIARSCGTTVFAICVLMRTL